MLATALSLSFSLPLSISVSISISLFTRLPRQLLRIIVKERKRSRPLEFLRAFSDEPLIRLVASRNFLYYIKRVFLVLFNIQNILRNVKINNSCSWGLQLFLAFFRSFLYNRSHKRLRSSDVSYRSGRSKFRAYPRICLAFAYNASRVPQPATCVGGD